MKDLLIIGARGMGREIFFHAQQCLRHGSEFAIKGFLDDKADALDGLCGYPSILGSVEKYIPRPNDVFICALGDPKFKRQYVELIQKKGGQFHTLIHPTAIVSPNASLGKGVLVMANVCISCEVRIADFVTVQPFCVIGHDAQIESFAHLNAYAFMGGYSQLEEGVTLHTGAKVLPHKKVGAWATIGAGSVVLRNVKPGQTAFGLPAMPILE